MTTVHYSRWLGLLGGLGILWIALPHASAFSLTDLRQQKEKAAQDAQKYGQLVQQQQQVIQNYDDAIKKAGSTIEQLATSIQSSDQQLQDRQVSLKELEKQILDQNEALIKLQKEQNEGIIRLYELGSSDIGIMTEAKTFSDFSTGIEFLSTLEDELTSRKEVITKTKTDLENKKIAIEKEKNDLAALQQRQMIQKSALALEQDRKGTLLEEAQKKEKTYSQLKQDAINKQAALEQQLNAALKNSVNTTLVKKGHVSRGDVIGYMGSTGYCFDGDFNRNTQACAHLHFEVIKNRGRVNPRNYTPGFLSWPFNSVTINQEFAANRQYRDENGVLHSMYGPEGHSGIDLSTSGGYGAPIRAAADGDFIELFPQYNGWMPDGYGCYKIINHGQDSRGDEIITLYGHMTKESC